MAVVRNLMIRIGADYSAAQKGMQGATKELSRFKRDTEKTISSISGRNGLGSLRTNLKTIGSSVTASLSEISGSKGIGGVMAGLAALRPAVGLASASLRGLGAAAGGAAAALGPVGIGLGILTGAIIVATAAIAKASQPAVKFEADLGRLNMQLKGSSREFMMWARSMGLAKTTAAEMGATYGTLLSSFISDNKELTNQTKQIVQATRVVASATGRTIEDTTERIRSGLLGNTEAIEDLGIFVNVSMIESTNAFKKFANGKHWDQLDFRVQQQIRLAAILEQAYARYGNELQNNVMTKQSLLMEQLKNVKLNLSQAFLPIWDAILPALTKLATALATVTEEIARFMYWLRGWDYDERTMGTEKQTEAVQDQSKAYDGLASSAKKARGELAAFDQLNLLGDPSGGGGGGGASGGGSPGGTGPGSGGSGSGGNAWDGLKPIPPALLKKWRIEFDPPNPPDAGLGAVATAVVNTINGLVKEVKAKLAQMWQEVNALTQMGAAGQLATWGSLASGLSGSVVPGMSGAVSAEWAKMWGNLQAQTQTGYAGQMAAWDGMRVGIANGLVPSMTASVNQSWAQMWKNILAQTASGVTATTTSWKTMLAGLLASMTSFQASNSPLWSQVVASIKSPIPSLADLKTAWNTALADMRSQFSVAQSAFTSGWTAIGAAIRSVKNPLAETKAAWNTALSDMYATAAAKMDGIISKINSVITAWSNLQSALTGAVSSAKSSLSSLGDSISDGIGYVFSKDAFNSVVDKIKGEANKTQNQVALEILGLLSGGGVAAGAGKAAASSGWLQKLLNSLKGAGISIPAFASGGIVSGPTLAMVGEYAGASANPEVIAPLSDLERIMDGGDNAETVAILRQIYNVLNSGRNVTVTITQDEIGRAAASYINNEYRRGNNPLPSL